MARTNGLSEAQEIRQIVQERFGSSRNVGSPEIHRALHHRHRWESALGADFSDVRVHEGPQGRELAAAAFTGGRDLFFAPGQRGAENEALLGHELAHVMQQRHGRP